VTYFEGDPESGLAPDEETRQIWLDLGVAEDHILTGGIKDNFWDIDAKGGTGPCGPSTEVHFDRIGARNAAHLVNKDDPTVIEFWNNVFIQFNRQYDGTYQHLPDNHVDSAIGFERLTSVVQNGWSNYDLDVFTPILRKAQEITGAKPYQGSLGVNDINGVDKAYRVIVDHIRTLAFSLSDGGLPGNTGRGFCPPWLRTW
jgi:alanyl-tRNA synthetase